MGNYRPVLDEGLMYGTVDVTERKRAEEALRVSKAEAERAWEEAERASRAKSEFPSGMSHEYNREGATVTLSCQPTPGGRLRMAVADTGPGIPSR